MTRNAPIHFTTQETREIAQGISVLLRKGRLHETLARTLAKEDARRWYMTVPPEHHAFWRVYETYADVVITALRSAGGAP